MGWTVYKSHVPWPAKHSLSQTGVCFDVKWSQVFFSKSSRMIIIISSSGNIAKVLWVFLQCRRIRGGWAMHCTGLHPIKVDWMLAWGVLTVASILWQQQNLRIMCPEKCSLANVLSAPSVVSESLYKHDTSPHQVLSTILATALKDSHWLSVLQWWTYSLLGLVAVSQLYKIPI